ncbi:MAG: T9SS type A sorting domain-containing protein, partial [Bacteroidales bacterium]
NPSADGKFSILSDDTYTLTIYDFSGRKLEVRQVPEGNYYLDLSKYAKGIYLLQLENKTKKQERKIVF